MPQFAIYRNPGRNRDIPFVVQIQSSRLERSVGRVVIPLVRRSGSTPPDHPLTPHLHVEGEDVFANPFDLATVPAARLGIVVGILDEHDQDKIIRALDELVSKA
ncbi:CcdB family protein [Acetobacter persici]|uniref:Toxin CcdB n=1 Tax=Acetobacter persici TaxID=1076596 RepID=A0A1U9LHL3_9PROT|nr:CcdB family protein [Acetobacter persici]AQT05760.1 CcdB cytotoxin-like protein [Acetobacter persici]MBS0964180.1 CcdB family protein [Acetobacter persici]